ncbi:MAG: hypothetical protein ACJAT4_003047 [Granulosicoccus sp.]|jgi:hypothetical protein
MNNLSDLKIATLIHLIECPEEKSKFNKDDLKTELSSREILETELKNIIIKENEMIARMNLENDDITEEKVNMHQSHFLSEEKVKEIYITQLEEYMKHREGFRFNVWQYALGGI